MKFDCGETLEERITRLSNWHRHFAIFPVKIKDHDCRWFEVVERRGSVSWGCGEEWWTWEYRPIE